MLQVLVVLMYLLVKKRLGVFVGTRRHCFQFFPSAVAASTGCTVLQDMWFAPHFVVGASHFQFLMLEREGYDASSSCSGSKKNVVDASASPVVALLIQWA